MQAHAKFKTPISIDVHTETERGDIITLREPLLTCWKGRCIYVPTWFQCDGVSVPRFLWISVSPQIYPQTLRAAICHDYIYRVQPARWTRKDADMMFYECCREDGLSWWPAQKAYYGLRLFGGKAWNDSAKK